MKFVVIRLGKDSVPDIVKIDSYRHGLENPYLFDFTCKQVEESIVTDLEVEDVFAFIYLGSDNNKGIPTVWKKGLRALGVIQKITGRFSFQSTCVISINVLSIFPSSYSSITFLENTSELYKGFSNYPVIGLQSSRNNAIQKVNESERQDTKSLINAISIITPTFRFDVSRFIPQLIPLLDNEDIELEGYETESEELGELFGWGSEYPLNTVLIRTEQRTVNNVVDRIMRQRFKLTPDFQRDFVWNITKQSKLIESCLMRIPLPVFYVAEDQEGKIVVVDGLQRLTTFVRYLNGEFALKGIGESNLSGLKFKDLPLKLQERIEDTQLILYILDEKAPERAKLDIFDRVNGGTPLTRQQMRNSLYSGAGTKLLKDMSKKNIFLRCTGKSLDTKSMRDREVINRFFAFYLLSYQSYKGDMDEFLARSLKVINKMTSQEVESLENIFENTISNNFKIFGPHAFRKSLFSKGNNIQRSVINVALFDVFSIVFSDITLNDSPETKLEIKELIRELYNDPEFYDAITIGTNSTKKVNYRFSKLIKSLSEYDNVTNFKSQ
ncbi:MAG: DUF262 domain-containing protein [Oceanospirillaceae bacterium]|nr:DUF262 domain-containing protein [Oceanospirillaceae bacterium]